MADASERSLGDDATFAGHAKCQRADVSIGDERTLGDGLSGQDTISDDIEVVDLEARYKIEGTLGQGGMGAVLLATDTRLDRKVAIKRILGEAAGNRMAVNRFLTEAKSIAALNHPNIVQIFDYGRAKDGPFLIMEYVEGGSLLDKCREAALPLEDAIDLACQLCDGLAKAHDLGIIHRDIKPANVLLTRDGSPKLTDFGLAKAEASDHGQTMTGAVLGTPDFMPPEQRRDASEVDARSDLWSLAATVYQMVTGRSPKIIRFKDVPESVQEVLGKGLEDRKDSRYQTARELRDALKTSLLARAPASSAPATGEGACPSCGVQNDSSRRFCRCCGGSLEAPCLSCTKPMPMAEEICGACGAKQSQLLDERRQSMAARQAEAEGLLGDFAFDRARAIATEIRDESHPKLGHLRPWATAFLEQVEESGAEQTRHAMDLLVEAGKHEAAHDYLSAAYTLDMIPEALRQSVLPGMRESATAIRARISQSQAEVRRLEDLVKQRLATKSLDDLLPDVEKLLALQPDREDLKKLRVQLLERRQKQEKGRDEAVAAAKASVTSQDYESTLRLLGTIPAAMVTPEIVQLREQAEGCVRQVRGLAGKIKEAVAAKQFDGLLGVVEKYLALKPADAEIGKLRQSLIEREEKISAEITSRLEQARKLEQACRFEEAHKVLGVIPEARRSEDVAACLNRNIRLAPLRQAIMGLLGKAGPGTYATAIESSRMYQATIAEAGITDGEFAALLEKTETTQSQKERTRAIINRAGMAAAAIAAVLILTAAGLWMRSSARTASLATALQKGSWSDALAIDADNVTALVGRARGKLGTTPPDIEGAFSDLDQANRTGREMATVKAARGDVHAARAREHAQGGRLDSAAQDLVEAETAPASQEWILKAKTAILEAWVTRGEQAGTTGDVKLLQQALVAAKAAGASDESLATLRSRGLIIEAVALLAKNDRNNAVTKASEALALDPRTSVATLEEPAHEPLRKAVISEHHMRLEAAPEAISETPSAVLAILPPIRNSIGIELKLLPAARFTMGQASGGPNETPHEVTLNKPFFIGAHEVTNEQWKRVMTNLPSFWQDDDKPVEQVSWHDAITFCETLSALPEEKAASRTYRLPTEAEWEYACRGGTTTAFSFGAAPAQLKEYAWFIDNSNRQTHPVGSKKPNAWGLFDMHGNVWEWCSDSYVDDTSPAAPNIRKSSDGSRRAFRGGSWLDVEGFCRSGARSFLFANRDCFVPSDRRNNLGFRVVVTTFEKNELSNGPMTTASVTAATPTAPDDERKTRSIRGELSDRPLLIEHFDALPRQMPTGWKLFPSGSTSGDGCMTLEGIRKAIAGDTAWGDYVLTAKVMLAPNVRGNAGIVFRVNSPGPGGDEMHGYYTGFNERELQLGKMEGRWHPLATVALKPGEVVGTNLLRAHVEGNRLRVWLNPTSDTAPPRFDVRDEVSPILHGSIGVRVHEAIARFDAIEVVPSAVNDSIGQAAPPLGITDATGKEADRPKAVELRFGTIAEADRFVEQVNGLRSYSEWQQPPLTYLGPAENGKKGSITYYFDFGMPMAQIRLQTTTNCWNFQVTAGGSGRGTSSVFVSANGNDWVPLRDDVRKKVWGKSQVIDENLPSSFKGTSKLWIRVELLQEQTPSNYATAQFGRSDGTSKESFLRVIATPNSKQ